MSMSKCHFLRERIRAGEIKFYKHWGPLNVADALTQSLPQPTFHKHAPFMHGIRSPFTGLSPTQVAKSSLLSFSCTSSPFPQNRFFCLFLLLDYVPFFNMIFGPGIDTVVNEWLSHCMPLLAPGAEGKLESWSTVTRMSLGCLIASSIFNNNPHMNCHFFTEVKPNP